MDRLGTKCFSHGVTLVLLFFYLHPHLGVCDLRQNQSGGLGQFQDPSRSSQLQPERERARDNDDNQLHEIILDKLY